MFWRVVAKVFGLGMLTVRPTWREVRYKLRGKMFRIRHALTYARQRAEIEQQQQKTAALFKELAERLAAEADAAR